MRQINLRMDGNKICATWDDFDCLAVSPAGFGDVIGEAVIDLIKDTPTHEYNRITSSIENVAVEDHARTSVVSPSLTQSDRDCRLCINDWTLCFKGEFKCVGFVKRPTPAMRSS